MSAFFGGRGSIRRKLFLGALLASLVGLVVAGASLFAYDLHTYRESSAASLAVEAALMGQASAAALQFDDRTVATSNLELLRARPGVRAAALYNPRGAVFAFYLRPDTDRGEIPPLPEADGVRIEGDRVRAFHRIIVGGEIAGTMYLVEDLEIGKRVASYAAIAFAVLVAGLAVSALLSVWVQKGITGPIIRVSELAQQVVSRRDYSVRAERTTNDEIAMLVDGFNDMLSQIESRTAALEASSDEVKALNRDLERRVAERTAQLEESNLRLKAANQAKSSFLSMMSHEIRTPMNGVLGMLELLSLTELDGSQRTTLGIVRDSGRSLLRIIDDILDFSKIEAGKLEVRPEPAAISRIVKNAAAIYSGTASSKGLVLKSSCDPRISPALMVDPMRLQQVLNNLTSNAVKFTLHGFVEIKAELEEHRGDTDLVRICVIDTGIGIPEKALATLFQPFSQASGDVARTYGGTGLGLSIGRRLVELMGGTIAISSVVGRGTTVTVTLPLPVADPAALPADEDIHAKQAPDAIVSQRRAPPTTGQARAEGTLVLVVDDHPVNRMLIARQVAILGYAHVDAENGREALELWRSGDFGLVLTDCNMPEMDGYALAREIRARERSRGLDPTPIVACTANALPGEVERCFAAGMNDYLAKPVDLAKLAVKLDHWLPLPGPQGNPAPIDRATLAVLADGDTRLERDILEQFSRSNAEDLRALAQAFDARDAPRVTQAAHRIKGASRSVGASAVGEVADRLEAAARIADWEAMTDERRRLLDEAERLDRYLAATFGIGK